MIASLLMASSTPSPTPSGTSITQDLTQQAAERCASGSWICDTVTDWTHSQRWGKFAEIAVGAVHDGAARHDLPAPRLFVEPGRSIAGKAAVTAYTVGTVKVIPGVRTYVAVDGGMSEFCTRK